MTSRANGVCFEERKRERRIVKSGCHAMVYQTCTLRSLTAIGFRLGPISYHINLLKNTEQQNSKI